MAFPDDYAATLTGLGINIDASAVPGSDVVRQSLGTADSRFPLLDPTVRHAFDQSAAEQPVSFVLGLPDTNAAPGIPSLLEAFNHSPDVMLSQMPDLAEQALQRVESGGSVVGS